MLGVFARYGCLSPPSFFLKLNEKFPCGADTAGSGIRAALRDLLLYLRIAKFQVVFELVGAHEASDGNAIFLQDEILLVQMNAFDDRAKINAGFS